MFLQVPCVRSFHNKNSNGKNMKFSLFVLVTNSKSMLLSSRIVMERLEWIFDGESVFILNRLYIICLNNSSPMESSSGLGSASHLNRQLKSQKKTNFPRLSSMKHSRTDSISRLFFEANYFGEKNFSTTFQPKINLMEERKREEAPGSFVLTYTPLSQPNLLGLRGYVSLLKR